MTHTRRAVVIADTHCHPWSAFATGDGATNSRLLRSLEVLRASLQRAQDEEIPWIFAGDIVHTAGYALNVVLEGVIRVLREFPDVDKLAVWGNHDARGVGGRITYEQTVWAALCPAVPHLRVLSGQSIMVVGANGLSITGDGYQPELRLVQRYPARCDIGVFHQTVYGARLPTIELLDGWDPRDLLQSCRLAIVGHVHHPQQIDAPDGSGILIPGSPEHHNFGDRDEHGWWVVHVPEEPELNPEVEFIPGGSPEFITVETVDEVEDDGNFYRVRRMTPGAALPENAHAIAPTPTTIQHRLDLVGASRDELLTRWVELEPLGDLAAAYVQYGRGLLVATELQQLRPVRLLSVSLHNFCSYFSSAFSIRDGLWLVTGKGRDYPSNGAGKTSLFEAIFWCLFGRTTKGQAADEVVRRGTSGCSVTIVLEESDDAYSPPAMRQWVITRERGSRSTLTVEEQTLTDTIHWEAASATEMTQRLSQFFGLTPALFQALCYFSQERLLLFSAATDGERKEMLADLMGLTAYQNAASRAGAHATEAEGELNLARARKETLQQQLGLVEAQYEQLRTQSTQWEAEQSVKLLAGRQRLYSLRHWNEQQNAQSEARVAGFMKRALAVAEQARIRWERVGAEQVRQHWTARFQNDGQRVKAVEHQLERLEAQHYMELSAAEVQVEVQKAVTRLEQLRERSVAEHTNLARLEIQEALALSHVREEQRREAEEMEWLGRGECPTCHQVIDSAHAEKCIEPIRVAIKEKVQAAAGAKHALQTHKDNMATTTAQLQAAGAHARALQLVAMLHEEQARQVDYAALTEEQVAAERSRVGHAIAVKYGARTAFALEWAKQGVVERDRQWKELEMEVRSTAGAKNPFQEALRLADEGMHGLSHEIKYRSQLADEHAKVRDMAEYWRKGFGKQGLQSLLMDEIAGRFNALRGDIFPTLTQGIYDVQFSTLSETRSGDVRERTNFVVYERGQPVSYAALSGGQRRRIDVGVMLVLVLAVSQWMAVPGVLGLLVLDEVFGFLDASGAEGLVDALRIAQANIPAIYTITHDPQLQALLPDMIVVAQDAEGVSHVLTRDPV